MNGMELSCVHSLIRQSIVAQLVWNPQFARWGGGGGGGGGVWADVLRRCVHKCISTCQL